YFFLSSDDASRVYLSTSETAPDPAVDTPIVYEPDCCNGYYEPDAGDPATTASPIPLQANQKYAVLALLKEAGGGDYLRLAWRKATDTTPAAELTPIPGQFFASYADPNSEVTFTLQPTDEVAQLPSASVAFTNVDFGISDGGFTVTNTDPEPPGPFYYDPSTGTWTADGSVDGCGGPYNSRLYSPEFVVPASQSIALSFSHRYSFEGDGWDGAQVHVSVNGGPFSVIPKESFIANGYFTGRTIQGSGVLNGQYAFNGDSPGYSRGEYITTTALLGDFAEGDRIVVQFLGGWDDCATGTHPNWVIKSVALSAITPPTLVTFEADAAVSRQGTPVSFTYQWQRNDGAGFVDITDATGSSYSFFASDASDFTATFRVLVGVPGNFVPSAVVKVVAGEATPTLSITSSGETVTLTYTGTLQSAPSLSGPFQPVTGASSPYSTTASGTTFYRAVQ
ncbi:MAG: hypothetical protein KIT22_10515, partial [Verrucomicrobiae bacterium]|nr:hypothetical protein [Verrucomicrobiae bacterium]